MNAVSSNRRRLLLGLPLLVHASRAAACGLAANLLLGASAAIAQSKAASVSAPRVPKVSLVDQDGNPVALAPLLARGVVAVNFIYTGCASFCPPQTAIFRELQQQLAATDLVEGLLVSISIDPLSDTPAALKRYAKRFDARLGVDERWLMLTGELNVIDRVLLGFGLHPGSLADHPAQVWVGHAASGRWRRTLVLAGADDVLRWMRELAG